MGNLNLTADMAKRLGLPGMTEAQCRVASALWMTKPVSPTEAALICLEIPLVKKSRAVEYFKTPPPSTRIRKVSRSRAKQVYVPPVHTYIGRPAHLDGLCLKR